MITKSHTILYVSDQEKSAAFYTTTLNQEPRLNVPGMTEFDLTESTVLGLMPKAGILRLFGSDLPHAGIGEGVLQAELYLMVDNPEAYYRRAISAGARKVSDLAQRNWGDEAAYCLDPDGYILAFAMKAGSSV